jgi:LPXTG-motif cell wall-anchored protein
MKKLLVSLIFVTSVLAFPAKSFAADDEIICPEAYGGGVVCGIHTPVNTGIGDNLAMIGGGIILASGVLLFLSKKIKKLEV